MILRVRPLREAEKLNNREHWQAAHFFYFLQTLLCRACSAPVPRLFREFRGWRARPVPRLRPPAARVPRFRKSLLFRDPRNIDGLMYVRAYSGYVTPVITMQPRRVTSS